MYATEVTQLSNPDFNTYPLPEITKVEQNQPILIIPDVDPNYLKDTDSLDYIYIAQRYIWLALNYAKQNESVLLLLPFTAETESLRNFVTSKFPKLSKNINAIFIDSRFYLLSNSVSGLLPNIPAIRKNPSISSENLFGEIPNSSFIHSIVQKTQNDLSTALKQQPPKEIRTYYPHSKFYISPHLIGTSVPQIYGQSDLKQIASLKGKQWMHPHWKNDKYLNPDIITIIGKESLPIGYFVSVNDGIEGLKHAILKLQSSTLTPPKKFIIKPILASSGEGISFAQVDSNNQITFCHDPQCQKNLTNFDKEIFKMGDVIVEELLDLNNGNLKLGDGNISISVVVPYTDGRVEGFQDNKVLLQLTQHGHYLGGALVDNTTASNLFDIDQKVFEQNLKKLEEKIQQLINNLGLKGSGAIDILITKDNRFLISDPNLGRDTGSMPLRTVRNLFEVQPSIMINVKVPLTPGISPSSLMKLFLGYPTSYKRGTLPITFAQDDKQAHLSVLLRGSDLKTISEIYNNLLNTIKALGNPYKPATTELFSLLQGSNGKSPVQTGTISYGYGL